MSLIGRNLVDVIRDMNYSQQKFIILKYYKAPFRIESFALYDYELNSDKVFVIYNEENNGRKCKWSLGNPEWRGDSNFIISGTVSSHYDIATIVKVLKSYDDSYTDSEFELQKKYLNKLREYYGI